MSPKSILIFYLTEGSTFNRNLRRLLLFTFTQFSRQKLQCTHISNRSKGYGSGCSLFIFGFRLLSLCFERLTVIFRWLFSLLKNFDDFKFFSWICDGSVLINPVSPRWKVLLRCLFFFLALDWLDFFTEAVFLQLKRIKLMWRGKLLWLLSQLFEIVEDDRIFIKLF